MFWRCRDANDRSCSRGQISRAAINLAASIGGLVCNPIVFIYRDAEVGYILRNARTKMLFIPERYRNFDYVGMANRLRGGLPELKKIVVVRGQGEGCASYEECLQQGRSGASVAIDLDPNSIKMLLYTSGTTGSPKGVLHTHNTLMADELAMPTVTLGILRREDQELGATTDGRIVNHEVRICDPVSGAVLPAGVEGEIATRGPEVMVGYTDWSQTEEAFDAAGYFRMGDLGYISHGDFITVSGRKKDLIIRGGENLSPKDRGCAACASRGQGGCRGRHAARATR